MSSYTRGQLPRESVPKQGEKPGFVASHDTTGNEDFRRTSPLHPFPVKDADLAAEIEAVKQTQQEILARLDAGLDTRLTGSKAEYVGYSTDTKPEGEKGDSFLELDGDKNIYIHDGTKWVVF